MSEETKCEVCENTGRRRRGMLAPAEGFYAEIMCNDEPYIFWTCSTACRDRAVRWQSGASKLDLTKCPKCDAAMPDRVCPGCGFDVWAEEQPGPVVEEIAVLRARIAGIEAALGRDKIANFLIDGKYIQDDGYARHLAALLSAFLRGPS